MKIGSILDFDIEKFRGQRAIFQGAAGSGKSNGARLLLEQTYGVYQHIVLDVEDEFHTLRTAERQYAILGGNHADVPLSPDADAGALALTLLEIGASTVLQIADWTLDQKRSFIGGFIAGMMRAKSELWHPVIVLLDETHQWVPQQGVVASSEAVTHLATAGRKRGFSAIFATQRLSLINKDVLGQCENKFLGRVQQSADRRTVADLLGFQPNGADALGMQSFKTGEFYAIGPAIAALPTRDRLLKASTEAPKPGVNVAPVPSSKAMQAAFAQLAEAHRAAEAAKFVQDVKKAPAQQNGLSNAEVDKLVEEAMRRGHAAGYLQGRDDAGVRLREQLQEFISANEAEIPPIPDALIFDPKIEMSINGGILIPQEIADAVGRQSVGDRTNGLSKPATRLIQAIEGHWPAGLTLEATAKLAGVGIKSSGMRSYLRELDESGRVMKREDGRYVATTPQARPGESQHSAEAIKSKLPPAMARIIDALVEAKEPLSKLEIAEKAAISPTSSALGSSLRELQTIGVIEKIDTYWQIDEAFR